MTQKSNASRGGLQTSVPPEGCQHYACLSDVPWDIQKLALYMPEEVRSLTVADTTIKGIVFSRNTMKEYG